MDGVFQDWARDSVGRDRFMHSKILYEAQQQGKKWAKESSHGLPNRPSHVGFRICNQNLKNI